MDDQKYRAAQLIVSRMTGMATPAGEEELDRWLEASPRNRRFYDHLTRNAAWGGALESYAAVDHRKAFGHFRRQTGLQARALRRTMRYAAAALLPAGVALFFLLRTPAGAGEEWQATILPGTSKAVLVLDGGEEVRLGSGDTLASPQGKVLACAKTASGISYRNPEPASTTEFNAVYTPRGGEYQVTLSDGSVVYLNSDTRLRFPVAFGDTKREVHLSGEAYFEVAKDSRPFVVVTDRIDVRVYGTAFNINTHDRAKVQTVLVRGEVGVSVRDSGREYRVKPSQMAEYDKADGAMTLREVNTAHYVAWKEGYFVFEDRSLEQIMQTLSLWYDMDVAFADPRLRELRFTGHMRRYNQINVILNAISAGANVRFSIGERSVTVSE